jgi:hypothetical protein
MKSMAQFTRTCRDPKAAHIKKVSDRTVLLENPAVECKEYAIAVTSYWDKEFMKKFSTKSTLLVLLL